MRGSTGSDIAYNYDGTRATVVNGTDSTSEAYTYTADGLLAQVSIGGVIRARYSYDTLGRTVEYDEYSTAGYSTSTDNRVYWRDNITYDAASLLQTDRTTSKRGSDTYVASSSYGYNQLGWTGSTYNYATETFTGAYMGGVVTHVVTTNTKNSTSQPTSDTANQYGWSGTRAIQLEQYYVPDTSHGTSYNVTGYIYDNNGGLKQAQVADGAARTIDYINDSFGQVMKRDQTGGYSTGGTPHEIRYYFGGIQVGDVSNNGTSDTDYAQSIAAHTAAIPTSPGNFRGGATTPTSYANFDLTYNPVNGDSQSGTASAYTAAAGDTLQSIAQAVYGDAALWYVIADANGLSASDTIAAGQVLSIPANVSNIHNTSGVFRVYDPNQAIGDIAPTVPKAAQPKHNNCGIFGQIILAVVAVVVAFYTAGAALSLMGVQGATTGAIIAHAGLVNGIIGGAIGGAAGSIVSQGVGLATGIQNKFDWGGVAMAAIGGAVGAGVGQIGDLTTSSFINGAIRGVIGNVITQGIGVATGLQKKFDWAGVAAAGVGGGVFSAVSENVGLGGEGSAPNTFVSATASMIVGAAARSLINGTDFGDNIIAGLPDVIGQTISGILSGLPAQSRAKDNPAYGPTQNLSTSPGMQQIEQDKGGQSPQNYLLEQDKSGQSPKNYLRMMGDVRGGDLSSGDVSNLKTTTPSDHEVLGNTIVDTIAYMDSAPARLSKLLSPNSPEIVVVDGYAPSATQADVGNHPTTDIFDTYLILQRPIFERPLSRIIETDNVTFCPTTVHIPPSKEQQLHMFLDVLSFVPVVGPVPMALNAVLYAHEGNQVEAAVSLTAAIVGAADLDAGLTKLGINAAREGVTAVAADGAKVVKSGADAAVSSKPQWLQNLEEGNEFNRVQAPNYPHNEVYIDSPSGSGYTRLDSYNPDLGEIVSRKFTQLSDVQESTAIRYINEIPSKYPVGGTVANVRSSGSLGGATLQGQYILEVPVQVSPVPLAVLDAANNAGVLVRDVNGHVY